MFVKTDTNG